MDIRITSTPRELDPANPDKPGKPLDIAEVLVGPEKDLVALGRMTLDTIVIYGKMEELGYGEAVAKDLAVHTKRWETIKEVMDYRGIPIPEPTKPGDAKKSSERQAANTSGSTPRRATQPRIVGNDGKLHRWGQAPVSALYPKPGDHPMTGRLYRG